MNNSESGLLRWVNEGGESGRDKHTSHPGHHLYGKLGNLTGVCRITLQTFVLGEGQGDVALMRLGLGWRDAKPGAGVGAEPVTSFMRKGSPRSSELCG